jgi:uncharacterized membrane protein
MDTGSILLWVIAIVVVILLLLALVGYRRRP